MRSLQKPHSKTSIWNKLAIGNIIRMCLSYKDVLKNAPNHITLLFETPDGYKFNAEYIKPGRFSSMEMHSECEDLLKELLRGDIGYANEQKIVSLFLKHKREL